MRVAKKMAYRIADNRHLPLYKRPEQTAVATPAEKLMGLNVDAVDIPMTPPKIMDIAPSQGPSIIPINGAATVAIVMNFPATPIIGNKDKKDKIVYKGAKQQAKAISFTSNFKLSALFSYKL